MDREYRLAYCRKCTKRDFSFDKGVICSLTNEQAQFDSSCADFEEDPEAAEALAIEKQQKEEMERAEETLGMENYGIKNGIAAGIIMISLGFLWLVGGVIFLNRIFIYSFILMFIGIVAWVRGARRRKREKAKKTRQSDILDNEILND